jgi:anti-anti-sigma factor
MRAGGRVVARRGEASVVDIIGDIDMDNVDELRSQLDRFRGERVTVDLTQATFVDPSVRHAFEVASTDGTHLTLHGATGVVRRALEVAGLDQLFT